MYQNKHMAERPRRDNDSNSTEASFRLKQRVVNIVVWHFGAFFSLPCFFQWSGSCCFPYPSTLNLNSRLPKDSLLPTLPSPIVLRR